MSAIHTHAERPGTDGSSRSAGLHARALEVLPGGVGRSTTSARPHPFYAAAGAGAHVTDVDGRRVIDLQGNYTSLVHGHAHPAIVRAATDAVETGASFGLPTETEVTFAETLVGRIPSLDQVRFTTSGTEAVMMAIQAARAHTGRPGVLRFTGAYHGLYDGVLPAGSRALPAPLSAPLVTVPFDDAAAFRAAIGEHGDALACVLLDLMPNRAGLRPASQAFADEVASTAAARGIALVLDEVITFRLHAQGLQQAYGLRPDLVALGKVIGGGFPIGAFGGRREIMDLFDPRRTEPGVSHGGTFAANPVSLAAGLASVRLLDQPAIDRIGALGDTLREGLRAHGLTVTGRGSLARVLDLPAPDLWRAAYDAGVLVANNGLMAVSTVMEEDTVDDALRRLTRAWTA
jgi:glutamate-1-semialdehyde 2,1-aminomutase